MVRSAEHVGIGMIASYLRSNKCDVDILEIRDIKVREQYDSLLTGDYNLIGFTTTCVTLNNVLTIAGIIKEKLPQVGIVLGGHMATFAPEEILQGFSQVDYIITGEGEITFHELVQQLSWKKELFRVKGLVYRNSDTIVRNEDRELIENLDILPFAARDQFIRNPRKSQYLRISTSRGCYGNCAFCSSFAGRKQKGNRWRGRSVQNVVDEIEYLVKNFKFHTFDFVDSTFEDPGRKGKERIQGIAKEIIKRNLKIYYNCCFRAENWKEEDKDTLSLLVKSGLEKVNIGFESGNDRGLKILNKNARMKDNWKAIKVLKEFDDIYITFGFIMLHPYTTLEDIYDNACFLHDTGIGQVIRHYFWQLEVYPGTLMEDKLIADGLLTKDYCITDGMYEYRFVDERVNRFAEVFKELLTVQSVWDFEIFDIIIHTFIARLKREYLDTAHWDSIRSFNEFVVKQRREIADFNFKYFMKLYNSPDQFEVSEEKIILDKFLMEKMELIRREQYKVGHTLLKAGKRLVGR